MNIKLEKISKDFKGITILNDVNIEFKEGNIYGLIGKNGSGKSVLLKIICGFYKPTNGHIYYDGTDIHKDNIFPPNTRALIEKPNFLSNLTGFENLKLLASIENKITDETIKDTLEKVNLTNDMNKKYHQYSLGMKQKLGIAQVLMENPKVIILDEPFNGIEEKTAEKVRGLLIEEKEKGKIILIATHIKEDIDQLADEVYKFDDGNVTKIL